MRTKGVNGVGRFAIDFEVANFGDVELARRGLLRAEQIRRKTIAGWVDPGVALLVLPKSVVNELGLVLTDPINVRYADGRRAQRRKAEAVYVELLGRHDTFTAIVEPKRDSALIGTIVLEALDLLVDCPKQRLIPRDPEDAVRAVESLVAVLREQAKRQPGRTAFLDSCLATGGTP
jgi:predicted aspartyl protease